MPRQHLLTWQPTTRHQMVTCRQHKREEWVTRGPQLAHTPFSFFLFPPTFFHHLFFPPPLPPSSGLPSPKPTSSLSPTPQFSPPPTQLSPFSRKCSILPNQQEGRSYVQFRFPPPAGHPARSPSSLSSPLLRRTPTPGHRRAPFSSRVPFFPISKKGGVRSLSVSPTSRPSRSPSSLSSPLLRRTPTPGHRLRRAPPSPPQTHSPLRAGLSPSLVCIQNKKKIMNSIHFEVQLLDWVIFVWFLRNFY